MMPFRTFEGPRDVWISHYISNRIGDSELNTILLSLIKQGVVMQVHSASEDELRDVQDHGDDTDKHGDEDFAHNTDADHSDTDGKSRDDSANDDHQTIDNTCTLSWAGFPTPAPSATSTNSGGKHAALHDTQTDHERLVFRLLKCIGGAICATALPQLQPSCECIAEPLVTASEELASHSYRIDGGLKLLKTTSPQFPTVEASKTQPSDIVVNFSSKLQKGYMYELYLDRRWSASYEWVSHIMYNDCRRTHTYSITIEDTNIALWHFSRSHFAKSSDLSQDVRAVVHALSALIFSTPEELGYDKDITRITETDQNGPHIRYVYKVCDRHFKTLRSFYEYESLRIPGRATRTWEVIEVHDPTNPAPLPNAQPMVLRDAWIEKRAGTESDIQKEIFDCCDELGANFPADDDPRLNGVDEPTRQELRRRLADGSYKELFLSIEADERGAISKPIAAGFTVETDIFGAPLHVNKSVLSTGADTPGAYELKQRNFVVYKEVCCALHDVKDLHDAVKALLDCLWAVQILFLIGWIHRDISAGNILFYNGRGILGDLEYVKKFDVGVSVGGYSDRGTGTPSFMAAELQTGLPIYRPHETFAQGGPSTQRRSPAVRHNFQHDVESFFWSLLWVSLTRIPGQATANVLFQTNDWKFLNTRIQVIMNQSGILHNTLQSLRSDVRAGSFPPLLRVGEGRIQGGGG